MLKDKKDMKLTTEKIKNAYNLLSGTNAGALEDADRIKLVKIRAALKPVATAYNDFDKDLTETLKFEKFDELNAKALSNALAGEELVAWNLRGMAYTKSLKEARKPELEKEHDVELQKISLSAYLKLEKENSWPISTLDALEFIVEQ